MKTGLANGDTMRLLCGTADDVRRGSCVKGDSRDAFASRDHSSMGFDLAADWRGSIKGGRVGDRGKSITIGGCELNSAFGIEIRGLTFSADVDRGKGATFVGVRLDAMTCTVEAPGPLEMLGGLGRGRDMRRSPVEDEGPADGFGESCRRTNEGATAKAYALASDNPPVGVEPSSRGRFACD